MNPAFQAILPKILAIFGGTLLFFSTRAKTPSQPSQQQRFDRAIELLEAFQNDRAYHLLSQLHQELEASQNLHSPFSLHVRLRQAEALERDHQDEAAIQGLLPIAEEARAQGKFWEMSKALFDNQPVLDKEGLMKVASDVGLDMAKFAMALDQRTHKKKVMENKRLGEQAKVMSTPSIFINGRPIGLARTDDVFNTRNEMERERGQCS